MKVDGSVDALRSAAARDPKAAVKEAAKQFEALFMQQLMKSMRDASMSSGMLDNEGSKLGTEMLDGQFAVKMTGLPGGLAQAIERHLERQMSAASANPVPPPMKGEPALSGKQAQFVNQHLGSAHRASQATGIPASFIVAQAAHESGWGRSEITGADGAKSHNLFGIKAGPGWRGAVAETTTTEVIDGVPRKVSAKFRAYASYAEAFDDYARLIGGNARYADVIAQGQTAQGFAQGLQRAGYATDPQYADKLSKVINTTLRVQRAQT